VRVLRCAVANFRGFERTEIVSRRNVLLVGEPRGGRSHLLATLGKVFEIEGRGWTSSTSTTPTCQRT
jgi:predicted ATP-dependent endonuclease of OLD family